MSPVLRLPHSPAPPPLTQPPAAPRCSPGAAPCSQPEVGRARIPAPLIPPLGTRASAALQRLGQDSRSHRIAEAGKDLCGHRVTPVTDHHRDNQALALRATSGQSLNTPRDGDSTTRALSLSPAVLAEPGATECPCRDCVCQGPKVTAAGGEPWQSVLLTAEFALLPDGCQGAAEVPGFSAAMRPRPGCCCRPGTLGPGSPQTLSLGQRLAVPGVWEPVPKSVPVRRAEDASTRGRIGRGGRGRSW
ncbi:uncharacterized protein LOC128793678 [Vidua chalybeata]|uniref:uncharacterized protein LOC128793678 n=1 Tax=Vidua chalybeata TaxID=81927 RepID=UPI0023A8BD82|nr:uncharacterized protein LOC128793678 [Vidua chalybeata]